jgi:hypothetical protein
VSVHLLFHTVNFANEVRKLSLRAESGAAAIVIVSADGGRAAARDLRVSAGPVVTRYHLA